jgi:hypothetical protein
MECRLCHKIPMERGHKQKVRNIASLMEVLQSASPVCFLILLPDLDSYICLTCHKKRLPVIYKKPTCAMSFAIFVSNLSGTGQHFSILMQLLPPNLAYKLASPVLMIHE